MHLCMLHANPVGFCNLLSSVHICKADAFLGIKGIVPVVNVNLYGLQMVFYLESVILFAIKLNTMLNNECLCSLETYFSRLPKESTMTCKRQKLHCSSRFVVTGSHSQLKANNVLLFISSSQEMSVFPGKWHNIFAIR